MKSPVDAARLVNVPEDVGTVPHIYRENSWRRRAEFQEIANKAKAGCPVEAAGDEDHDERDTGNVTATSGAVRDRRCASAQTP